MVGKSEGARGSRTHDAGVATAAPLQEPPHGGPRRGRSWRLLATCTCLLAVAGCTTVTTATVKEQRSAGITREYDRPPGEVYQASVLALENLRSDPNWRDLTITEKDPATGTVIAMRDLDSAVIPGLGERDGIGIFVSDTPGGDSAVTVVRMSSDQFPGDAGTKVNTARDASSLLFPAIDAALATVPEGPRTRTAAASTSVQGASPASIAPAPTTSVVAPPAPAGPASIATAPAAASRADTTLDRLYAFLRDGGTWRPLAREVARDGSEQIRIGTWATLTTTGSRVTLHVKTKSSAVETARLALDLEHAGFAVDVTQGGDR